MLVREFKEALERCVKAGCSFQITLEKLRVNPETGLIEDLFQVLIINKDLDIADASLDTSLDSFIRSTYMLEQHLIEKGVI